MTTLTNSCILKNSSFPKYNLFEENVTIIFKINNGSKFWKQTLKDLVAQVQFYPQKLYLKLYFV